METRAGSDACGNLDTLYSNRRLHTVIFHKVAISPFGTLINA